MKNLSNTGTVEIVKRHISFTELAAETLKIIGSIQAPCHASSTTLVKGTRFSFIHLFWFNPNYLRIKINNVEGLQIITITFLENDFNRDLFVSELQHRIKVMGESSKHKAIVVRDTLIYT